MNIEHRNVDFFFFSFLKFQHLLSKTNIAPNFCSFSNSESNLKFSSLFFGQNIGEHFEMAIEKDFIV